MQTRRDSLLSNSKIRKTQFIAQKAHWDPAETAQQLNIPAAIAEDLGLVSSTHTVAYNQP